MSAPGLIFAGRCTLATLSVTNTGLNDQPLVLCDSATLAGATTGAAIYIVAATTLSPGLVRTWSNRRLNRNGWPCANGLWLARLPTNGTIAVSFYTG
jgi:hypothetical protein